MVDLTFTAKVIFPRIAKTSKIEGERWKTQAHLVKSGGQLIFALTGVICNQRYYVSLEGLNALF